MEIPSHKQSFSCVQVSEDEIVVGSYHSTPFAYNVESGALTKRLCTEKVSLSSTSSSSSSRTHSRFSRGSGAYGFVSSVVFLARFGLVATAGSRENEVVLWRRSQRHPCSDFELKCRFGDSEAIPGSRTRIFRLDALNDGSSTVVLGCSYGTLLLVDASREKRVCVLDNRQHHESDVQGLCHDNEKQILFSGGVDGRAICWDLRSNQRIGGFGGVFSKNYVQSLTFRPARNQLVVPCFGGQITVVDLRNMSGTSFVGKWKSNHTKNVYGSCNVGDSDFFVTTGYCDNQIKAWREDGKCLWSVECVGPLRVCPFLQGDPEDHFLFCGESLLEEESERIGFLSQSLLEKFTVVVFGEKRVLGLGVMLLLDEPSD